MSLKGPCICWSENIKYKIAENQAELDPTNRIKSREKRGSLTFPRRNRTRYKLGQRSEAIKAEDSVGMT